MLRLRFPTAYSLRQRLPLWVLVYCLLLQASIPVGYMPGSLATLEGPLVFCGVSVGDALQWIDDPAAEHQAKDRTLCVFSALSPPNALPELDAIQVRPYLAYKPEITPVTALRLHAPPYSLPGARAPPLLFS